MNGGAFSAASDRDIATDPAAVPNFSPVLLMGLALRPLPPALIQAVLSPLMRIMTRRHPQVFARLQALGGGAIVIDASDLPFLFELRPNAAGDKLRLVPRGREIAAIATIRGPLAAMLALLQGRCDGDALFFSRTLTIEGDTGSVLTLRNAIDSAEIDLLADVAAGFGRMGPAIMRLLRPPLGALGAMMHDAELVRAAITQPVATEQRLQSTTLRELQNRVEAMGCELRRLKPRRDGCR